MSEVRSSAPLPDDIQAALEAASGALVTLKAARAQMSSADLREAQAHADQAIELVQRSITELRAARGKQDESLALGFVLPPKDPALAPEQQHDAGRERHRKSGN